MESQYDAVCIGRTDAVRERFYAISVDRKLRHPAVAAIASATRKGLFDKPTNKSQK